MVGNTFSRWGRPGDETDPAAVRWTVATRRRFLAGAGAAATAGSIAGCLGGGRVTDLPPPVAGDPDGDLVLAVYSDFACPHCKTFHESVFPQLRSGLLEEGGVRFEHRDFPIPVAEEWSWQAAGAARAVQDEAGDEAFWAFAAGLYATQGQWTPDLIEQLAADVGADGTTVRQAAMEGRYRPVVAADRERGVQQGVEGTPTVLLDGTQITPSVAAIERAVADAR